MSSADRYIEEKYDPKTLAKIYADHVTDKNGDVLARVWESVEFQEVFDYKGGYQEKGLIQRRQEQIWRQTDAKKQLFQKVYYNPALLAGDESELATEFTAQSQSFDSIKTAINFGMFALYFPALYGASLKMRGIALGFFTVSYGVGWYTAHRLNQSMLQSSLNKFAKPYFDKYNKTE